MKRFSFAANVMAALVLSTLGVVVSTTLQPWIGKDDAGRLMVLVLSLGYLVFLLHQCRPRYGLSIVASGWVVCALALLLFNPPLLVWMLVLAGALWLLRSALRYQRLFRMALDGALNLFAAGCAFNVLLFTHSLWLSLWSYFLALAFTAAIPARTTSQIADQSAPDAYEQARSSAESALRRLQKNAPLRHS